MFEKKERFHLVVREPISNFVIDFVFQSFIFSQSLDQFRLLIISRKSSASQVLISIQSSDRSSLRLSPVNTLPILALQVIVCQSRPANKCNKQPNAKRKTLQAKVTPPGSNNLVTIFQDVLFVYLARFPFNLT